MRVSHKQKELFEKDVRSYHRLNDENNYLFLRMQKGKKYIFGWLVLVGLYFVLPHEFDYLIEVVFTISFFWVFDFLRLSELRKKNDKQIKRLVKNFENKYGIHPTNVSIISGTEKVDYRKNELTFDDDEFIPWEYLQRKILLNTKVENTELSLLLDPSIQGLSYSVSGRLCQKLYSKPTHKIFYKITYMFKQSHLIKLEQIFKDDLEFLITPQIVETFFEDYEIPFEKYVCSKEFEEFNVERDNNSPYKERVIYKTKWEIDGVIEDQIISIRQSPKGTWLVHESNSGPKSVQSFGKDENEYWIEIKEPHVIDFLQVVLERSFRKEDDGPLTIEKLETILTEKGVIYENGIW